LSMCFLLAGIGTPGAYLLMELINVGLAALGLWALGQIGRRMWNARLGVISAWLGAVYPPLVYAVTRVQAVNWSVNFFLLGIYCVILLQEKRSPGMAATSGVCLGLGSLGEPILLAPTVAALSLFFWVRERRLAGVAVVALALTLAPWLVRNMVVHSQPVLVKSTFWYVFWQGNNMQATGTDKVEVSPEVVRALSWRVSLKGLEEQLKKAREQTESVDSFISPEVVQEIMRQPREIDKMGWFRRESLRILQEHTGHYMLMCGKRAWKFLWFDATNPGSLVLAYRLPYLLLLVLAVVGVVVSVREPPRFWIVPVIMCVALMAVHVLVIASARFRFPVEAVLLLPAAATISRGIGAGHPRRQ
jgi:hypothetical protein